MLRFATWNVNSIRARLYLVVEFLTSRDIDVLFVQETRVVDEKFPVEPFKFLGYEAVYSGEPRINGVAVISRVPVEVIPISFVDPLGHKRILAVEFAGIKAINVYVPRGGYPGEEMFNYKMEFIRRLRNCIETDFADIDEFLLAGDFNVAPEERDVFDPEIARGQIGFMDEEREAIFDLMNAGLVDLFRKFHSERAFSWWDYRLNAFKRDLGLRLDHIWVKPALAEKATNCFIDRKMRGTARPSDHAPVIAEFRL